MAKEREMTRKTTTVERIPAREGDPIAGRLKDGMKEFARFTIEGYAQAFWLTMDDSEGRLDVFKKLAGQFMKKGELAFQQVEPSEVESFIITTWGPGTYQLRPMIGGKYYGPASVAYKIGDTGDDEKGGERGDGLEELVGRLAVAKQLKELREGLMLGEKKGEDDGMKAADVQVMLNTAIQPLQTMLASSERRAEVAEQRNHELQLKLMEMANGRQQSAQGSIAELVKLMPKEALAALLSPADTPGWAEKAVDALREFGPALAQMLMEYFRPGAAGTVPGQAALPAAAPTGPQPTETADAGAGGGNRMPIQLNPEQLEAKKMLLDCIRERDFANAYAMIENFPGFTPTPNGPMPIGSAFLSMVDPKVTRPRIYVIQMMQLVPELAQMLDAADAFIAYVQKRLMDDQEAFLKEQRRGQGGADPRPTTRGEEDERA
jgi:hypothetical protein